MNKKISTSIVASLLIATNIYAEQTQLDEITVTSATKTAQSIKDVTSNIDVITSEEIEERHFTTVAEALNTIAGINITNNGGIGSSTTLGLRGTGNNRTLILIDGVKFKDYSSISGTDISNLMINNIKSIEILKGAQSGIWGADAAAGVINIITKDIDEGTHLSLFAEAGSFKTKKFGASVSHNNKNFDIKFDANRITSDSFSSKSPKGDDISQYEDDYYENTSLGLKSNIYITDATKVFFSGKYIDSTKDYDSSGADDDTMKNDSQSKIFNIGLNHKYNEHDITIKFDKTNIKRDQIGTTYGVKLTDSNSKNLELTDTFSYANNSFLLIGLGAGKDDMDYTDAFGVSNNASNETQYTYITNNNDFNNLIFTQSLRYDKFDNFDSEFTGKIGAKYNFTKDFNISTNYGTSYSVPQLVQNVNPWGGSNLDIKPEESKSFDIGFEYKNFNFTYFDQKVTNLIDWYDEDGYLGSIPAIYKNLDGESRFKGYELAYKQNIGEDLLINLNYTHLSANDSDGENLAKRAKRQLGFGVDYYGINKLHLNVNGSYIGDRFQDDYYVGRVQTGNYTVWNSVINYEINKTFSTYLKVDNLFNKYYQNTYGYATAERSAYIGLKATF